MQFSNIADGLHHVRLMQPAECEQIIGQTLALPQWGEARVVPADGDAVREDHWRSAKVIHRSASPELFRTFQQRVEAELLPAVQQMWDSPLNGTEGTQLVRYDEGDFYRVHTDATEDSCQFRHFTVVCYLNEDFVGGTTAFPGLRLQVSAASGMALVFPSDYPHQACPVEKGSKYALVTWLTGLPPIRWI
jgi:predicted 2-oxoglutarate/Fe(II)-dependent dioxygenase YbiX